MDLLLGVLALPLILAGGWLVLMFALSKGPRR